MKQAMLPPTLIAPDIKESVNEVVNKAGIGQAEAVRQGLRFGLGRFMEALAVTRNRQPSNIRGLLDKFPPLDMPANRKQAYKDAILKKYAAH